MTPESALAVVLAAIAAGTINTVVGSGTLITFPTLLALGYPPVIANVSNNIGLVPGGVAGTWGYRRELRGQTPLLRRLAPISAVGGVLGALLLLRWLPPGAFAAVVPALIMLALVLVLVQPWLAEVTARRAARVSLEDGAGVPERPEGPRAVLLFLGVFLAGVYGGYFGAAQGVMLMGVLGAVVVQNLQRTNAVKNVLASLVNGVSTVTFLTVAPASVDWAVVGLLGLGSTLGGVLGAAVGRRLPAPALRGIIVVVGLVAVVHLAAW